MRFVKSFLLLSLTSVGFAFSAAKSLTPAQLTSRLHAAITAEDATKVTEALTQGANINSSVQAVSHLTHALRTLNEGVIDVLLQHPGLDLAAEPYVLKALESRCSTTVLQKLIARGANVNQCRINKKTALEYAVEKDLIEYAKILVQVPGINLDAGSSVSPLALAIDKQHEEFTRILVNAGANVNLANTHGTPLLIVAAAHKKSTPLVATLLSSKACNIDAHNNRGSALTYAAQSGLLDIAKLLVAHNANPNIPNHNGKYPLELAIENKSPELVATLLTAQGIDINKGNNHSPLCTAIANRQLEIVQQLVAAGANIDLPSSYKTPPLYNAISCGEEMLKALLTTKQPYNIDACNSQGNSALHRAIDSKNITMVEMLIQAGARADRPNANGKYPLEIAIEERNAALVEVLLTSKKIDVNKASDASSPPLAKAAYWGNTDVIQKLVAAGADVTQLSRSNQSPLDIAVKNENEAAVRTLVEQGKAISTATQLGMSLAKKNPAIVQTLVTAIPNINTPNGDGTLPICIAIANNPDYAELILARHDFDPSVCNASGERRSPLIAAVSNDAPTLTQKLLAKGAPVAQTTSRGKTALHFAAARGNDAIIDQLLAHNAPLDAQDLDQNSPLHTAVATRNTSKAVEKLITAGASVTLANKDGQTPLHVAIRVEDVAQLLAAGANIDAQDNEGKTPLHYAAERRDEAMVDALLKAGANPNAQSKSGQTPLHFAAPISAEIAQKLVDKKADINAQNNAGRTPLHNAAQRGKTDGITFLIGHHAALDIPDKDGNTPLHLAAECHQTQSMQALIDAGANVNITNAKGETPLNKAQQYYTQSDAAQMLTKHGGIAHVIPLQQTQQASIPAAQHQTKPPQQSTQKPAHAPQPSQGSIKNVEKPDQQKRDPNHVESTTESASLMRTAVRATLLVPLVLAGAKSLAGYTEAKKEVLLELAAAAAKNGTTPPLTSIELEKLIFKRLWKTNKAALTILLGSAVAELATFII